MKETTGIFEAKTKLPEICTRVEEADFPDVWKTRLGSRHNPLEELEDFTPERPAGSGQRPA
jgi:hypothetical protein